MLKPILANFALNTPALRKERVYPLRFYRVVKHSMLLLVKKGKKALREYNLTLLSSQKSIQYLHLVITQLNCPRIIQV